MDVLEGLKFINISTDAINDSDSKSEQVMAMPKQQDPIDFLIVSRIPQKSYKFQWIIQQFSLLSKDQALYSIDIHALTTYSYQLKMVKYEHGFGLFHVSKIDSNGESAASTSQHGVSHVREKRRFKFGERKLQTEDKTIFGTPATSCIKESVFSTSHGFGFEASDSSTSHGFAFGASDSSTNHGFSFGTSDSSTSHGLKFSAIGKDRQFLAIEKSPEDSKESPKTLNENYFPSSLEYRISASDSSGKELMKWSLRFADKNESLVFKIGEYINNSLVTLPDDSLTLDCNLKVILSPITEEITIAGKPSLLSNGWENLSRDFKALYYNGLDTDITLVVGTDKIRAHKLILAARSPIFKKELLQGVELVEQSSLDITDVQFSVLQRLVEFLYTGVILDGKNKDMDRQGLYDLYSAANKYEVLDLREMVGNALLERIHVDNACQLLTWADNYNDKNLKFETMNFIRIHFEAVSSTKSWKSCSRLNPKLAMEVVKFCLI